jgi:hypothetical protein
MASSSELCPHSYLNAVVSQRPFPSRPAIKAAIEAAVQGFKHCKVCSNDLLRVLAEDGVQVPAVRPVWDMRVEERRAVLGGLRDWLFFRGDYSAIVDILRGCNASERRHLIRKVLYPRHTHVSCLIRTR